MGSAERLGGWFIFAAVVAGTVKGLHCSASGACWLSQRELRPNHRIVAADLGQPPGFWKPRLPPPTELAGRYIARAKRKGQTIKADELQQAPELRISGTDRITVFYPLRDSPRGLVDHLDAGSLVRLCTLERAPTEIRGRCTRKPLQVVAVLDEKSRGDWLALSAARQDLDEVSSVLLAEKHLLVLDQP
jgi:hypothetical protein